MKRATVPDVPPPTPRAVEAVVERMAGARYLVLAGAGCSTESGIPDYRGGGTLRRARSPVKFATFVKDPAARRRYWARSAIGWPRLAAARPNPTHRALARLEGAGRISRVITQNVDRLHHAAGSRAVVELHGALKDVRCLACGVVEDRDDLQARLLALNPGFSARSAELAPDGDADLSDAFVDGFEVAGCRLCAGDLKPDVVFFGESVPRDRVEAAYAAVEAADGLLVVGSSLAVLSGFRFVKRAHDLGRPVIIVNAGETRGDPLAAVKLEARLGEVLPHLADRLGA